MIVAEIDATGWAIIIGAGCVGVGGVITSVIGLVFGYLDRKRQDAREDAKIERDRQAAVKVEEVRKEAVEVKETLKESTTNQDKKLNDIHELVNSAMLEQKRMHAAKCQAAALDNPTQANIAEAKIAQEVYDEHKRKQDAMERKETPRK